MREGKRGRGGKREGEGGGLREGGRGEERGGGRGQRERERERERERGGGGRDARIGPESRQEGGRPQTLLC